jgi:uncharacterized membrane protein
MAESLHLVPDIRNLPAWINSLFLTGSAGAIHMSQGFLLGAAMLMETAIAMVLLSRILKDKANRWANVAVGALQTVAVLSSVLIGITPTLYYLFFAVIEIACTLLIVWYALRWKPRAQQRQEQRNDKSIS